MHCAPRYFSIIRNSTSSTVLPKGQEKLKVMDLGKTVWDQWKSNKDYLGYSRLIESKFGEVTTTTISKRLQSLTDGWVLTLGNLRKTVGDGDVGKQLKHFDIIHKCCFVVVVVCCFIFFEHVIVLVSTLFVSIVAEIQLPSARLPKRKDRR